MTTTPSTPSRRLSSRRLLSRRLFLAGSAAAAVARPAAAQAAPIPLGVLVPLTGTFAVYGQMMAKTARAVIDEVNAAGGVNGRPIALVVEDDASNPDGSVRGARKLIEVDRVAAIMGTYASAGTMAIAPLCWEGKTLLATVSGADAITQLPHEGFIIRTQPNTTLQGRKFGEFALEQGAKKVQFVSPQTPFAGSQFDNIALAVGKAGGTARTLIYDDKKPSYRGEVDDVMRFGPDAIILGGYSADTTIMLKELFRAGFTGRKIAFGYTVNDNLLASVPAEATEATFTISPSPAEGSDAYARAARLSGAAHPDPYTAQIYDHANLIVLALAAAGGGTLNGAALRDGIRGVSQGKDGVRVDNAIDGMKLLASGKTIDYDGASGPCDFTATGDIVDCKFRYDQVKARKLVLVRIG
jgi:branched-chain amino acid transport system substrate-binding protein